VGAGAEQLGSRLVVVIGVISAASMLQPSALRPLHPPNIPKPSTKRERGADSSLDMSISPEMALSEFLQKIACRSIGFFPQ
jgi:hypothetical protein